MGCNAASREFRTRLGQSAMCSEFITLTVENYVFDGSFPAFGRALADMSLGAESADQELQGLGHRPSCLEDAYPAVGSDVPTLIIAGQLNSMTPPAWPETAAETLSNSYRYGIPGCGHPPKFSGPCPASLALQFLKDPTRAPDSSCVSEIEVSFSLTSTALQ